MEERRGEATGASLATPSGLEAGFGLTGTHGAEDDAVPVRTVAGVTLWRMRPQPRHSPLPFNHPRKADFSLGVVVCSHTWGNGPFKCGQRLPAAIAPQTPVLDAQEKHGNLPLMTGRAFVSLAVLAPPAAPLPGVGAGLGRRLSSAGATLGFATFADAIKPAWILELTKSQTIGWSAVIDMAAAVATPRCEAWRGVASWSWRKRSRVAAMAESTSSMAALALMLPGSRSTSRSRSDLRRSKPQRMWGPKKIRIDARG